MASFDNPNDLFGNASGMISDVNETLQMLDGLLAEYAEAEEIANQISERQKEIKASMMRIMDEIGLKTNKSEIGTITVTEPSTRTSIWSINDIKKKDTSFYDEIIRRGYIKQSTTNPTIKITINKSKEVSL